jgi:hypothetical protein
MRKIIVPLVAAAALAAPTSAFAHSGGHHHFGDGDHHGAIAGFEKLSGTGSSFASTSATATGSLVNSVTHPNGHFSATLSTTWSSAQTKTFGGKNDDDGDDDNNHTNGTAFSISCAPATASITLANGTSTTATYTGKMCSWTRNGATVYGFAGSASDGTRAFLREDGTTVTGAVFAGHPMAPMSMKSGAVFGANVSFSLGSKHGNCDHH